MQFFIRLIFIIFFSFSNFISVQGNVIENNAINISTQHVTYSESVRPIEPKRDIKIKAKKDKFSKKNKGPKGWFHITSILIFLVLLFGLICFPLGVALELYWLWMSALFVLAAPVGLLFLIIIKDSFRKLRHNNPTRALFKLYGFAFLVLVIADLIITGLISGIFTLWFIPAILLITVAVFALILEFAMR